MTGVSLCLIAPYNSSYFARKIETAIISLSSIFDVTGMQKRPYANYRVLFVQT